MPTPTPPVEKTWTSQVARVLAQLRHGKKCWCVADGNGFMPHSAECIDATSLFMRAGGKR